MQDTDDGVSLKDIMEKYDVSLRTAVRMKDSIADKYPQLKEINGRYNTKRWYLPKGTGREMVNFSMEEIHALQNASKLLATKSILDAHYVDTVLHKIKAIIGKDATNRIEPDAEALLEAEGYAFRPGPKIIINTEHLKQLRYAIIACNRIKINMILRTTRTGASCTLMAFCMEINTTLLLGIQQSARCVTLT